ncbi:MAG: 2-amino-4-hydroxy-6-hydroxymethyldihydropteridine diphosphokinase, partial [Gammaproteobacteria bacterium]|nr:2-amino-4-hydroxy-6-hydroxymethyldihydropteridine diphosphokinase [Gammaproteobacteria bacterium]
VGIQTSLPALALLKQLQNIEQQQHRQRGIKWGPRTIDLDLLLYGDWVVQTAELILPHPGITERNFVFYPLYDIAPSLVLPCGKAIASLLIDDQLSHPPIQPILGCLD